LAALSWIFAKTLAEEKRLRWFFRAQVVPPPNKKRIISCTAVGEPIHGSTIRPWGYPPYQFLLKIDLAKQRQYLRYGALVFFHQGFIWACAKALGIPRPSWNSNLNTDI
jgi:hypothetical protein